MCCIYLIPAFEMSVTLKMLTTVVECTQPSIVYLCALIKPRRLNSYWKYICLQNQLLKNRDMHVDTILTTHQSCITPSSNLPIDVVLHIELPVYLQNEF